MTPWKQLAAGLALGLAVGTGALVASGCPSGGNCPAPETFTLESGTYIFDFASLSYFDSEGSYHSSEENPFRPGTTPTLVVDREAGTVVLAYEEDGATVVETWAMGEVSETYY